MGNDLGWTKTVINASILERVSCFDNIGCEISPTVECDVENKFNRFKQRSGTIYKTLKH